MRAHPLPAGEDRTIHAFEVEADFIADLREDHPFELISMRREDALQSWQDLLAKGHEPSSWAVRKELENLGANGLIDPSRKAPGLWHLVLFTWNRPNAPSVKPVS